MLTILGIIHARLPISLVGLVRFSRGKVRNLDSATPPKCLEPHFWLAKAAPSGPPFSPTGFWMSLLRIFNARAECLAGQAVASIWDWTWSLGRGHVTHAAWISPVPATGP